MGKRLERVLLGAGLALMAFAAVWYASGRIHSRMSVTRFQSENQLRRQGGTFSTQPVDTSLWSEKRIHEYEAVLAENFDEPLAVLRIDRIHLEVPVFNGTDDRILNRGVGRITGTARVGDSGNIGIAGHRDGFFRGLKDIDVGDRVELETSDEVQTYIIDSITIVSPNDVSVLRNEDKSALTLVTCYPFYFIGNAPQRYIVHASLVDDLKPDARPAKVSAQNVATVKEKTE